MTDPHSIDMPFEPEPTPDFVMDLATRLSGGVIIMAAAVDVAGTSMPALVFRFATPTGQFYDPITLVVTPERLRALIPLVTQAVDASIARAS